MLLHTEHTHKVCQREGVFTAYQGIRFWLYDFAKVIKQGFLQLYSRGFLTIFVCIRSLFVNMEFAVVPFFVFYESPSNRL